MDFLVTPSGMSAFVINSQANPGLTLTRGQTYVFQLNAPGHPFWIKTVPETGTDSTFDTGVTNNGVSEGTLTFAVPASAPSPLYYQCQYHEPMTGTLTIVAAAATTVPGATAVTAGALALGLVLVGVVALRTLSRAAAGRRRGS